MSVYGWCLQAEQQAQCGQKKCAFEATGDLKFHPLPLSDLEFSLEQ